MGQDIFDYSNLFITLLCRGESDFFNNSRGGIVQEGGTQIHFTSHDSYDSLVTEGVAGGMQCIRLGFWYKNTVE